MADKMTKEEADVLVKRNPSPKVERAIQNLEVDAGAPKTPEATASAEPSELDALKAKLAESEAKRAEYKEVLSKKDAAIAEAKAARDAALASQTKEEPKKEEKGDPDLEALLAERDAEIEKRIEEKLKQKYEPRFKVVDAFEAKKEESEAVDDWGNEVVEKYGDLAREQQKTVPGLTFSQCLKLVVPAGTSTAPATPIESSRSQAPEPKETRAERSEKMLEEARRLSARGDLGAKRNLLERIVKDRASSLFPHGGEG